MLEACAQVNEAFPWFFASVAFILGTMIGSFLNVCILRIPLGKSIVHPGSHCVCGKPIAWYDNLPIVAWILLRGKARFCGQPFSIRYPAIELLTGLLFLACWVLFPAGKAFCGAIFVSALICATFIDLDHMIIPDAFTVWLGVGGVILSGVFPILHGQDSGVFFLDSSRAVLCSIKGMLVGSGMILWIALIAEALLKKEAMGFGDVKFIGAIGAFTGWQGTISAMFGGAVVGTLWFVVAIIISKFAHPKTPVMLKAETPEGQPSELGFGAHVPYGPMLAIAAMIHFFWLHRQVDAYFAELNALFNQAI